MSLPMPMDRWGFNIIVMPNGELIEVDSEGMAILPSGVMDASMVFSPSGGSLIDLVLSSGEGLLITPFGLLDATQLLADITGVSSSPPADTLLSDMFSAPGK